MTTNWTNTNKVINNYEGGKDAFIKKVYLFNMKVK